MLPAEVPVVEHQVNVTVTWTSTEKAPRSNKVTTKKLHDVKIGYVDITDLTRRNFLLVMFRIHQLEQQYGVGERTGPDFKLHWTGSRYVHS